MLKKQFIQFTLYFSLFSLLRTSPRETTCSKKKLAKLFFSLAKKKACCIGIVFVLYICMRSVYSFFDGSWHHFDEGVPSSESQKEETEYTLKKSKLSKLAIFGDGI
jgi:hypothetical protein